MKKDYIIITPALCKSNGVKTLYFLSKELEKKGYNAYLYTNNQDNTNFKYIDKITLDMRENAIVIYPEIVVGNPLRFRNVVRYVLYYPGKNGGSPEYDKSELIFAHRKEFYPTKNLLFVPWLDSTLFYDNNSPKTQDCYFVYKSGKWKEIPEFKDMTEITITYPKKRKDLANLLRTTETLYSYDSCSALLDEAQLCGCKVKIINENGYEDYHSDYFELAKNAETQLDNFIEKTQNMNWEGNINK